MTYPVPDRVESLDIEDDVPPNPAGCYPRNFKVQEYMRQPGTNDDKRGGNYRVSF